jgi:tape measure domain-containing protein
VAQDAQLLLKVGLDLTAFRNSLATLGQAATGYNLPIKVKFDRGAIKREISNLQRSIGRQKFNVELNIVGGLTKDQFEKIQSRLDTLSKIKAVEIPVSVRAATSQKEIQKVVADLNRSIKGSKILSNTGGKLRAPVSIRAAITQTDIVGFKREVENKLSGIKVKVGVEAQAGAVAGEKTQRPGFEAARRQVATLGVEQLRASAFKRLGEESRSAQQVSTWLDTIVTQGLKGPAKTQQLNAVRDFLANALAESASRGIEARMMPLRGQSRISAPRSASNINTILDPIAGLTKNPRAARRMLRMLPEERITTDLLGLASRQASYLEQVPSARGMQRDTKGFDPLLKAISEQFTSYTRSLNPSNPWIGKIGDGLKNITQVASVAAAQKALPPIGGTTSRINQSLFPVSGMMGPSSQLPPRGSMTVESFGNIRALGGRFPSARMLEVGGPPAMAQHMGGMMAGYQTRAGAMGGYNPGVRSSAFFPMEGMLAPSSPLGRITAQSSMFGPSGPFGPGNRPPGGSYPGGGGGGGGMFGGIPNISLPGSGAIRELGQEFAFATKQVLLFGQAYKLLAFIQNFPAQVGQAVGQLQSFRNTLNAISPSAAEAAKSNAFILSIVDKYNVPLQSARDGFTKLYASMAPAGFRGDEIRGLFESISMGAATFGMSADKVDRVIYAFSQMASKGQVMSEELKGQLGDVLPGAMALFAQAAGFEGPAAISKFSAALEDGAFKGENMVKLLKNVQVVMAREFGPGAEGAALTFQGGINRMQNSLTQLYEAFEPVAVGFMNEVVKPLTDGIRVAADGFTAFFQGVAARTPQGAAFAQELAKLGPSLEGIGSNLRGLLPTFELFGNILLNVGKLLLAIAGNPVTGFLLKVYANVLLVNTVFSLLGGKILVGLISSISASIARFIALNVQVGLLQKTTAVANSNLAGTQVQMALLTRNAAAAVGPVSMLKTALMGLARIGLIAIAIQVAIDGMAELDRLKKSLDDIAGFSSKEYKKQVQGLSREEVNSRIIVNRRAQAQAQKELKQFTGPVGTARGLVTGRDEELRARLVQYQIQEAVLRGARGNKTQEQLTQSRIGGQMTPITGGGDGGAGGKGKGAADKAAKVAERAAQERRELDARLEQLREQLRIEGESLETQQAISAARADGNEKLAAFLQTQEKFYEIDEKAAKLQREFAAGKIKQAELTLGQQLLAIERKKVEITEEERLNAVLRERYGITNEVMDAARKARENAFGLNLGGAAGFRTDINLDPGQKSTLDDMRQRFDDLIKTENQVKLGAEAIGNAFGQAFKDIASGSMTAQEALASMMQSIASHFLEMAAQIIAQQMTMIIFGTIMKALGIGGGGGGGFSSAFGGGGPQFNPGAFSMPQLAAEGAYWQGGFKAFADGGVVNGPTLGLVGEGGESEYIIPASKMQGAMARYNAGARGAAVIPAGGGGDGGGMGGASLGSPLTIDLRYSVERINSVDYVTADQFERGMARAAQQGAKQGEQLTLRRLQQSRSTRGRLGMN